MASINWIVGNDASGWAYTNNFHRLTRKLPYFTHDLNSDAEADLAIYFDVVIARTSPRPSRTKLVRIGGPRPLDLEFGNDKGRMQERLRTFDGVVALSTGLYDRIGFRHPNARMIPNGLDLEEWHPAKRRSSAGFPFTAGFAGTIHPSKRVAKGFDLAVEAASRAGVRLLRVHKGAEIPHERMIDDFYSQIDVLIHPSDIEGTSNVIMEALALGVPVITTQMAGFHGERLKDEKEALIRPRDAGLIAQAITVLRDHDDLVRRISLEARRFAERHHDVGHVAKEYEVIIRRALRSSGGTSWLSWGTRWFR